MIGSLDDYSSRPAQVRSVCDIALHEVRHPVKINLDILCRY